MSDGLITISRTDLEEIVRKSVRAEFRAVGLRADDEDAIDEAREDFRFVRRLRKAADSAAHKIGMTILGALGLGLVTAVAMGLKAMLIKGGGQ